MSAFDEALQKIVNMSDEEKIDMACDSYAKIFPVCKQIDPEYSGAMVVCQIFGTAAAADGKLSDKENALLKAMFNAQGAEMDDNDIMNIMRKIDGNSYSFIEQLAKQLKDEYRFALVSLIAAICAIDDRIAADEVGFIRSLLED